MLTFTFTPITIISENSKKRPAIVDANIVVFNDPRLKDVKKQIQLKLPSDGVNTITLDTTDEAKELLLNSLCNPWEFLLGNNNSEKFLQCGKFELNLIDFLKGETEKDFLSLPVTCSEPNIIVTTCVSVKSQNLLSDFEIDNQIFLTICIQKLLNVPLAWTTNLCILNNKKS
ncbi:hypothetical protein RFI_32314 [Reticulomyxa filosa]|uniref:Uncharacterized protein n=1 Tax=Reticulomyxa filosa TaxID=46433 RepID=X6LUL8_RETFI|nr:hypothetical protein RFI_32314 [Reticulomyxa filosa]|eukprot:ETO05081.1 hypothetical protein RFI_32314 [Reticulomyxa filosa]